MAKRTTKKSTNIGKPAPETEERDRAADEVLRAPGAGRFLVSISGSYDRAALSRLTWPIAWSGTTSAEARATAEAEIAQLVAEGRALLDETPDAVAVEVVDGRIVRVEVTS